jgi:hypothetical protein
VVLFFKVDSFFDENPPMTALNKSSRLQANAGLYDVPGRAYRAGIRLRH